MNCKDTYTSAENSAGYLLGPRTVVSPETGKLASVEFPHPNRYPVPGTQTSIGWGQIVVSPADIYDPVIPDAASWEFYFEHIGLAADEEDTTRPNNTMFKRIPTQWDPPIGEPQGGFQLGHGSADNPLWDLMTEVRGLPAMYAWKNLHDPLVSIISSLDGKWLVGYRVTKVSPSGWHYEYNVMNLASAADARRFDVPAMTTGISSVEFNDVNPSSGELCTCGGVFPNGIACDDDNGCVGVHVQVDNGPVCQWAHLCERHSMRRN